MFQDKKRIISCSKDGLMLSRSLNNGYKPYDFMQKNLLTIDLNNNIGFHIDMNKTSSNDSHA